MQACWQSKRCLESTVVLSFRFDFDMSLGGWSSPWEDAEEQRCFLIVSRRLRLIAATEEQAMRVRHGQLDAEENALLEHAGACPTPQNIKVARYDDAMLAAAAAGQIAPPAPTQEEHAYMRTRHRLLSAEEDAVLDDVGACPTPQHIKVARYEDEMLAAAAQGRIVPPSPTTKERAFMRQRHRMLGADEDKWLSWAGAM